VLRLPYLRAHHIHFLLCRNLTIFVNRDLVSLLKVSLSLLLALCLIERIDVLFVCYLDCCFTFKVTVVGCYCLGRWVRLSLNLSLVALNSAALLHWF
jgi:hypothetical protein